MTKAELDQMLEAKVGKLLDDKVGTVTKGFEERLGTLEAVKPQPLHTKGYMVDDGEIEQVGKTLFQLPGGSIVDTGQLWNATGKGFRRTTGMFQKLGEETKEFFVKMKEALREKDVFKVATKALSIDDVIRSADDQGGGLFVPEDVRYSLLQFAPPGTIIWPRAQVWPMTTETIQWPKLYQDLDTEGSEEFFGNVVMKWTEEGDDKTSTKPQFKMIGIKAHELSAYAEITDILIADSAINIGNLLVQLFQGTYWHWTDRSFIRGVGNAMPLGILNDPKIRTVDRIVASQVRYEDLVNMSTKLPPMFDAGAVWLMSKACFNSLRKQKDDNGQPVIQLGMGYNDFGEGIAGYILGSPVVMSDYKTNPLGQFGDVIYGDLKHYFIGERQGIEMSMSRHAAFQQNRTAFRASGRIGGIVEEANAFVALSDEVDASNS